MYIVFVMLPDNRAQLILDMGKEEKENNRKKGSASW